MLSPPRQLPDPGMHRRCACVKHACGARVEADMQRIESRITELIAKAQARRPAATAAIWPPPLRGKPG
eukprot:5929999-Pleurochrysis_carterae.AAC.1